MCKKKKNPHFTLSGMLRNGCLIAEGTTDLITTVSFPIVRELHRLPYSQKFWRLKIFADFVGQSRATKFFSRESFSSSQMLGVAGNNHKIFIRENPSKILGYYGNICYITRWRSLRDLHAESRTYVNRVETDTERYNRLIPWATWA